MSCLDPECLGHLVCGIVPNLFEALSRTLKFLFAAFKQRLLRGLTSCPIGAQHPVQVRISASTTPQPFHGVDLELEGSKGPIIIMKCTINFGPKHYIQVVCLPTYVLEGAAFQFYYVKGAARCFASITGGLTSVCPLVNPDLETIALRNAQLGQRGAIRKALDNFSWVVVFKKLMDVAGGPSDKIIKTWSDEYGAPRHVTQARVAIMNLITGVDAMLACLARVGTEET